MDILDYYFDHFRKSAVRLETLPQYNISETNESTEFEAYISGKEITGFANQDWLDCLTTWKKEGKLIHRIRICPEPLTDYFRYEYYWCYPRNIAAGEDIRFVRISEASKASNIQLLGDYWLFDDAHLVQLFYDEQNEYASCEEITDIHTVDRVRELISDLSTVSKEYNEKSS